MTAVSKEVAAAVVAVTTTVFTIADVIKASLVGRLYWPLYGGIGRAKSEGGAYLQTRAWTRHHGVMMMLMTIMVTMMVW